MFNCISWNVNSLRKRKRRLRVRQCLSIWKPSIVILQETRLESCNDFIVRQIWGNKLCGWEAIDSVGFLGGSFNYMGFELSSCGKCYERQALHQYQMQDGV